MQLISYLLFALTASFEYYILSLRSCFSTLYLFSFVLYSSLFFCNLLRNYYALSNKVSCFFIFLFSFNDVTTFIRQFLSSSTLTNLSINTTQLHPIQSSISSILVISSSSLSILSSDSNDSLCDINICGCKDDNMELDIDVDLESTC